MNKKSIAIVVGLLMASSFNILSLGGKALAVGNGNHVKCQPFKMNQVHLLPSRFQENMKRDSAWMMSIPVGSLSCRVSVIPAVRSPVGREDI